MSLQQFNTAPGYTYDTSPQWYGTRFAPQGGTNLMGGGTSQAQKYRSLYNYNPNSGAQWNLPPPPAGVNYNKRGGAVKLRAGKQVLPMDIAGAPAPRSSFFGGYPGKSFNS